jgi:hypothetical protein
VGQFGFNAEGVGQFQPRVGAATTLGQEKVKNQNTESVIPCVVLTLSELEELAVVSTQG